VPQQGHALVRTLACGICGISRVTNTDEAYYISPTVVTSGVKK
jgi:threonine dehydrogenase-like Zn-dependent dehydrogenase